MYALHLNLGEHFLPRIQDSYQAFISARSNATYALANAEKAGLLAPAQRGQKQLSAIGEQFVMALPNRDAAKAVLANFRKRRRSRKNIQQTPEDEPEQRNDEETPNDGNAQ
jgi:restriction endonuclease Mrr